MTDVRRLPNETVGLPAGFLRAGAGCAIRTLWPVADLDLSYTLPLGSPWDAVQVAADAWSTTRLVRPATLDTRPNTHEALSQ